MGLVRALFGMWAVAVACEARSQAYLDRTLYPERLHEEVELLRSAIHEAHPDPYRYHTRPELDALIDRVRDSITVPMSFMFPDCCSEGERSGALRAMFPERPMAA